MRHAGSLIAAWLILAAACGREPATEPPPERSSPRAVPPPIAQDDELAAEEDEVHRAQDPVTAPCGDARRCYEAGLAAQRAGQAVRAAELFGHACDLELGQACFRLGEMLRDGKGLPADEDRADALFDRGCRYGDMTACDALGH